MLALFALQFSVSFSIGRCIWLPSMGMLEDISSRSMPEGLKEEEEAKVNQSQGAFDTIY